ncbi:hypothetical protein B5F40_06005 [Gordonibacter sp. An230]|uniref:LuxR C-terminal-related transcriptional regulator n=1 Tax=Gordonibacter sp. An230 TaxID=1965592 RepID=UPI000B37AC75|nr:LuxR C-terminal-related transcriptional regulator [Gordonibacter sp. An230]OUO90741.1 hypothetical protein B5F40_06005 [Gordonibacter sp. An230]
MREGKAERGKGGVVLPSKVGVPTVPSTIVDRPALREKLSQTLTRPVTSVVSAAGYGKTTAIASWVVSLSDLPAAWYRIEAEDAPLERFWLHLTTALRAADERICLALDDVRLEDGFADMRPIVDSLLLQMEEFADAFVCVLDDFHEVQEDDEVRESVRYLLRHLPGNAHFVIASRRPLLFPTAKMKVVGELGELTEADLRFSFEETRALFAQKGVHPTNDEVETIRKTTQGWATGDKLVALLCGGGSQAGLDQALEQAQRGMSEYLFEEVFSVLDEDTRRFLVRTSAVESFCLPLAERITGLPRAEVAEHTAYLVANDLFIERFERQQGEDWFRYHRLLNDMLHDRLRALEPEELARVKRAAGDWYEENGFLDAAVEVSAELGDVERVSRIIMENWLALYMDDSHHVLVRWAACLPEGEIEKRPGLCAVLSMPYALRGWFERAEQLLSRAVGLLRDEEDPLSSLCLVQKAYLASFKGRRDEMRSCAEEALAHLPEREFYLRGMMLQIRASSFDAEPLKAKASFERAVELQRGCNNANLSCSAYCNLSRVCANLGYLQEADYYADLAFGLYDERERRYKPMLAYAYLTKMIAAYERGSFEEALELHGKFAELSAEGLVESCVAEAATVKAKALFRLGRPEADQVFFRALDQDELGALSGFPPLDFVRAYCTAFRTKALERCALPAEDSQTTVFHAMLDFHLAPERYEEACAGIDAIDGAERLARVHGLAVAAAFSDKTARPARALVYLEEAVRSAREFGLGEALAQNAAYLRPAAKRLAPALHDPRLAAYVEALLRPKERAASSSLTERELDVMRCVASGATVAQTAERLFVSRDTVKKHLANAYAKLGVHSKMQAVAVLRDEGVI